MAFQFHKDGTTPANDGKTIWVFGSNTAGRHGRGAAREALKFGATYGCGAGFSGNSFAIPTKDANLRVLDLVAIQGFVNIFLSKAREFDQYAYFVTRIGCGLAGYRDEDIASMFANAPDNCSFAEEWRPFLDAQPTCNIEL
jgi:hypothetical protein